MSLEQLWVVHQRLRVRLRRLLAAAHRRQRRPQQVVQRGITLAQLQDRAEVGDGAPVVVQIMLRLGPLVEGRRVARIHLHEGRRVPHDVLRAVERLQHLHAPAEQVGVARLVG